MKHNPRTLGEMIEDLRKREQAAKTCPDCGAKVVFAILGECFNPDGTEHRCGS